MPGSYNVREAVLRSDNYTCQCCRSQSFKAESSMNTASMETFNRLKGGKRKPNQLPYEIKGFRLFDKVLYNGHECFIK